MRIGVIGGGPAGLVFATLCRRAAPDCAVTVFERLMPGCVDGFGVGFFEGALEALSRSFPELWPQLQATTMRSERILLRYQGECRWLGGRPFFAIGRVRLLAMLRDLAIEAGVEIIEGRTVPPSEVLGAFDLVVGADGINSLVREHLRDAFQPTIRECRNRWLWQGTTRRSENIELIFQSRPEGLFIGHTYPFDRDRNTFVVECTPEAWRGAGFEAMNARDRLVHCEAVFADFLQGHGFESRRAEWFSPRVISPGRWSVGNVTLIGDALKTLHPSIGSGTRAAMEDAAVLAEAVACHRGDVREALSAYEARRKPETAKLQDSAIRSIDWYEGICADTYASIDALAMDFARRTGRVKPEHVAITGRAYTT